MINRLKLLLLLLLFVLIFSVNFSYSYTNISACQEINSSYPFDTDREIRLNQSISNQNQGCFSIDTSNFVFNCQNFDNYIQGDGDFQGTAFYAIYDGNITIINCNISDFGYGIVFEAYSNTFSNLIISDNYYYGIELSNANNNYLSDITISGHTGGSGYGIRFKSHGENNILDNIKSNENTYGLRFDGNISNNIIRNSDFRNNTNYNLRMVDWISNDKYGNNNTFTNNYLGNSSMISSGNWSYYTPNNFSGNYYLDYNWTGSVCFPGTGTMCDSNPLSELYPQPTITSSSGGKVVPFYNMISLFFIFFIILWGLL